MLTRQYQVQVRTSNADRKLSHLDVSSFLCDYVLAPMSDFAELSAGDYFAINGSIAQQSSLDGNAA